MRGGPSEHLLPELGARVREKIWADREGLHFEKQTRHVWDLAGGEGSVARAGWATRTIKRALKSLAWP